MCKVINCADHTPEQRKVVEDFDKLIASKLGIQPAENKVEHTETTKEKESSQ